MADRAPEAWTLAAARQGDASAKAELLRRFQDVWFRYCYSQLGNADAARDATQETALRFLERLSTFRGESELRTWSLGIALNVCREHRRKEHPGAGRLEEWDVIDDEPADATALSLAEDREKLRGVMRTLSPRQKEAVVLRYFEGLRLEDVAKQMGCAVGTVKATINQALRGLRKQWEDRS